jgi:SAM-dependent methyltransferase
VTRRSRRGDDLSWRANYETTVALAVRLETMRRYHRTSGPFGYDVLGAADVAWRRILEVGCGAGVHARRCVERLGVLPAAWVLLDRSEAMAREAQARLRPLVPAARAVVGEIERLPLADGPRFDVVVAMHVVQHVRGKVRALRALASRLAPGGRLVLTASGASDGRELRRLLRASLRAEGVPNRGAGARLHVASQAERQLRRVFRRVVAVPRPGTLEFDDPEAAVRYFATMPWLDGHGKRVRDAVHRRVRDAAARAVRERGVFRVTKSATTFVASEPLPSRRGRSAARAVTETRAARRA